MDLMGPMQVKILGGRSFIFVCVDDYSRYTQIEFIKEKFDTFITFKRMWHRLQRDKGSEIGNIVRIRNKHGRDFENSNFHNYALQKESIMSSAPITP